MRAGLALLLAIALSGLAGVASWSVPRRAASLACGPGRLFSRPKEKEDEEESFLGGIFDDDDEGALAGLDLSELALGDEKELSAEAKALTGMEELEEVSKDESFLQKYNAMKERGLSDVQIEAYLGKNAVQALLQEQELARVVEEEDGLLSALSPGGEAFQQTASNEDLLRQELLGKVPSHQLVETDDVTGEPLLARFVYVDEYTCIGCTHCASHAPQTFFMEDDFGRARVFQQGGDATDTVATAVSLCPVNCIHYVSWGELKRLEVEREGFTDLNFKARLVGSSDPGTGLQDISTNRSARCENCPTRGCYNCPMYGVGYNPQYIAKRKEIAKRKADKKLAALRELTGDEAMGESSTEL